MLLVDVVCWAVGGRKEGRRRGADTALTTKTPHVNLGNKRSMLINQTE